MESVVKKYRKLVAILSILSGVLLIVSAVMTVLWFGSINNTQDTNDTNSKWEEMVIKTPTYNEHGIYDGFFKDISEEYTPDQAVEDGCIVFVGKTCIEGSIQNWEKFLESSANDENAYLRVIRFYPQGDILNCSDLYYMHGMYLYYDAYQYGETELMPGTVPFNPTVVYSYLREVVDEQTSKIRYILTNDLELTGMDITKIEETDPEEIESEITYENLYFAEDLDDTPDQLFLPKKEIWGILQTIVFDTSVYIENKNPYSSGIDKIIVPRYLIMEGIEKHQTIFQRLVDGGQPVLDLFLESLENTSVYNQQEYGVMAQVCAEITGIGTSVSDEEEKVDWAKQWLDIYHASPKN